MLVLVLLAGLSGCIDTSGDGTAPFAVFTVSDPQPDEHATVTLDASASLDPDGDPITFEWDFDASNGIGVDARGSTTTHSWAASGFYNVTLTVSDGTLQSTYKRMVHVLGEGEEPPTAVCGAPLGTSSAPYYLKTIEVKKSDADRTLDETTTVTLNASNSSAWGTQAWITTWSWDLSAEVDGDNDGQKDNDQDASGEIFEWTDVKPGEYSISLTVTDSNGLTDGTDCKVYVNYVAEWESTSIAGATPLSDAVTRTFEFTIHYDVVAKNTASQMRIELVHPTHDDDNWFPDQPKQRTHLDLYTYNDTGEGVSNSTQMTNETRDGDNCELQEDEESCVFLTLSSSAFRIGMEGDWTFDIANNETRDATIDSVKVWIYYKR